MNGQTRYLETLLHPSFVEHDGCVFFAGHLSSPHAYANWKPYAQVDPDRVERKINHVHLGELSEDETIQQVLGQRIQQAWFEALAEAFPEREFSVAITRTNQGGHMEWLLDLWTLRWMKTSSTSAPTELADIPALAVRERPAKYRTARKAAPRSVRSNGKKSSSRNSGR